MARYIDADDVAQRIMYYMSHVPERCGEHYAYKAALKEIVGSPTADVEEVKQGEWKQGVPYVCSICGKPAPDEKNTSERYSCWTSPYCPHCGAKMDGGKEE